VHLRSALRIAPAIAALSLLVPSHAGAATLIPFTPPLKLTLDTNFGGYEPGLVIDHFGNIVVTAHKQNHGDAISPDSGALPIRAQSWIWMSSDGGKTFPNIPGLTALGADQLDFGDEGDVAVDDANHTYFVDTKVADISFTRWAATGRGAVSEEYTTPAMGSASPVDDRPWVIAHGNGVVQYLANEGDKQTYGPGRYTSYMSYDGGNTFDHIGVNLPDSGWCRPLASHHPGSRQIVVFCTNDGGANDNTTTACTPGYMVGTLWSYVSTDDGRSFTRHKAGSYNPCNPVDSWPSVAEDAAGNIYALYLDATTTGGPGPTGSIPGVGDPLSTVKASSYQLHLFRSTDHGMTWSMRDVTPEKGLYHYSWLDVAPDGTVGIAYYHAKDATSDWFVYSAIAPSFGGPFTVAKVSPDKVGDSTFGAMGDFFECMFGPDGRLNVVWTVLSTLAGQSPTYALNSDIYFSRSVTSLATPLLQIPPLPVPVPVSSPLTAASPSGLANTAPAAAAPAGATAAAAFAGLVMGLRRRRPTRTAQPLS
jgi:hypothetical protein